VTPGLALAALLAQATGSQPPIFAASTELVRIEVLVTRGDEIVTDLELGDFEVRDEGVRQNLVSVSFEETPVDLMLLVDLSFSVTGPKLEALREAALALLEGLRQGDRAALVAFRDRPSLAQPLTDDLESLRAALDAASGSGATALYDAAYAALHLWESGHHRRALVIFSDGVDNVSWLRPDAVVEAAPFADATVYGVSARGRDDPSNEFLRRLSEKTGGRTLEALESTDLRQRFLEVLRDIRGRYVISYAPEGVGEGGWHRVEVKLVRRRGDVLARPGYLRPASSPRAASPGSGRP
jgi:VWFA-related protein